MGKISVHAATVNFTFPAQEATAMNPMPKNLLIKKEVISVTGFLLIQNTVILQTGRKKMLQTPMRQKQTLTIFLIDRAYEINT